MELGILLQGRVSNWTPFIIQEYQKDFSIKAWIDWKDVRGIIGTPEQNS